MILFFFALGAIVASFIGVVVARLHTGQSIVHGRSRCDACDTALKPSSLVPIISFFTSGARAKCCGARISFLPPFSEIILGWLFVLSYLSFGISYALVGVLVSISLLLALVMYDLMHQILPDILLVLFIVSANITAILLATSFYEYIINVCVASLFALSLAAIHFFSRGRAMGLADAPLTFGLAVLVGDAALPGFVFSFWIGAVVGIALLLVRPRSTKMNTEVPFAPFLAAGFLLAYFTQWNPFIFNVVFH